MSAIVSVEQWVGGCSSKCGLMSECNSKCL
jgi:hypothetical protein